MTNKELQEELKKRRDNTEILFDEGGAFYHIIDINDPICDYIILFGEKCNDTKNTTR